MSENISIHENISWLQNISGYPRISRDIPRYPEISRDIPRYPRISRDIPRYPETWSVTKKGGTDGHTYIHTDRLTRLIGFMSSICYMELKSVLVTSLRRGSTNNCIWNLVFKCNFDRHVEIFLKTTFRVTFTPAPWTISQQRALIKSLSGSWWWQAGSCQTWPCSSFMAWLLQPSGPDKLTSLSSPFCSSQRFN